MPAEKPDAVTVDPLLSAAEVKRISSLSNSTIQRNVRAGLFPRPVQITPGGRIAWRQSDVLAWVADPLTWGHPTTF